MITRIWQWLKSLFIKSPTKLKDIRLDKVPTMKHRHTCEPRTYGRVHLNPLSNPSRFRHTDPRKVA